MGTPSMRNSVLLCMLLLGSVFLGVGDTHGAWQLKKVIDSTTVDAVGNPLIGSDGIRALHRYDRTDEPWSNPGKFGFTGWGADGRKYVNGDTSEIQGQISFEGNVWPPHDINGQQLDWFGPAPGQCGEECAEIVDDKFLRLYTGSNPSSASASTYLISSFPVISGFSTGFDRDEFVLRTRFRLHEDTIIAGAAPKEGFSLVLSLHGDLAVVPLYIQLERTSCDPLCPNGAMTIQIGNPVVETIVIPQNATGWNTLEWRKNEDYMALLLNNAVIFETTDNSYAVGDPSFILFGSNYDVQNSTAERMPVVDIDFLRFEGNATEFTQVPRAAWHLEERSIVRGPTKDFPEQALVVADHAGISILNVLNNDQLAWETVLNILNYEPERWMRFRYFNGNAIGNTNGLVTDVHMVNGKLIVPKGPVVTPSLCFPAIPCFPSVTTNSDGLFVIDFTDGYMYRMDTTDVRRTASSISGRNSEALVYDTVVHTTGLDNTNVAFVDGVILDTGETMVTVTEHPSTASLWDATTWERIAYYENSGDRDGVFDVALAKDGTWYVSENGYENVLSGALAVFYNIASAAGELIPDYQYTLTGTANSETYDWLQQVFRLEVRDGQSTVPGSNLLYWIGVQEWITFCGEVNCLDYRQRLLSMNENQADETQSDVVMHELLVNYRTGDMENPALVTPRGLLMLSDFGLLLSRHVTNLNFPTVVNEFALEVRNSLEIPGETLVESVAHSIGAITNADYLTQRYPIGGIAFGGSPTEVYYGLPDGLYVYEFINNLGVTLSSTAPATAAEYELLITPLRSIPDGSRIDLVFGGGFGGLGALEPADIAASGTNVTGSSSVIDATLRTVGVTLTTSAPVQEPIAITIGDGSVGGLNDIINPDIPGVYTVSYAIYDEAGVFIESGLLRLPFGVTMGADPLSFVLEVGAEIQEAAIMTFDATTKSISIDPLVNDGLNTSGFSQITVATNAPGGYALYARLDDGNGINQLSNSRGDTIAAGTGENAFGFEAVMGATYDALRAVVADSFFAAVDTLVTAGGQNISRNEATNPETHTVYYQVDVDFSQPAGDYSGTIYYSIVANF